MVTPPAQLACMQAECGSVRIPGDWWRMLVHPVRTCVNRRAPSGGLARTFANLPRTGVRTFANLLRTGCGLMRTYANLPRTKNTSSRTRRELVYIGARTCANLSNISANRSKLFADSSRIIADPWTYPT